MRKIDTIISLLLCLALILTGCSSSKEAAVPSDIEVIEETDAGEEDTDTKETVEEDVVTAEVEPTEEDTSADESASDSETVLNEGSFKSIADFSDYWNALYTSNEAVLNAYEGMPIMELVTPGLCFVSGVQYDILNINNENGSFEGNLMLSGYPGFVEKNGSQLTFGYEMVLEEDGFTPSIKKGDKDIEKGNCDLEKGYYYSDSYTEREGAIISRTVSEFWKQEDGSMCSLIIEGNTLNYNNEENLSTSYIFIRSGKDQYDFAVATMSVGTAFEELHLETDMTKEEAITMFESIGAVIENSGGISTGALVLD